MIYKVKYYNILNLYIKEVIYDLKKYAVLRKTYNNNLKKKQFYLKSLNLYIK